MATGLIGRQTLNFLARPAVYPRFPRGEIIASYGKVRYTSSFSDVERKVKDVVSLETQIKPNELQNNARFVRDLRVSRAGLRRLKIKLEKAFGTKIPEEDVNRMNTILRTIEYFSSRGTSGAL